MRHLMARLVYDTRDEPLAAGVRLAAQRARRLLFVAEEFEVVLQVSPNPSSSGVRVMGEVLWEGVPVVGATIRLSGPVTPTNQPTDLEGKFRLAALPRGDYSIEIGMEDRVVDIPTLDVGDAS
jgi:hypothetical protein